MLEKIGLPAKPSMRGNNWVVDATHCQGCSSQFTFINRKVGFFFFNLFRVFSSSIPTSQNPLFLFYNFIYTR